MTKTENDSRDADYHLDRATRFLKISVALACTALAFALISLIIRIWSLYA